MSFWHSPHFRRWGQYLRVLVGALLLIVLWQKGIVQPEAIFLAISAHPIWFLLATLLHGFVFVLLGLRWRMLSGAFGIAMPHFLAQQLTFVSHFFSTCLPGNGAGDVLKAWLLAQRGHSLPLVVGTMAMDRLMGMSGLFCGWGVCMSYLFWTQPISRTLLFYPILAAFGMLALLLSFGFWGGAWGSKWLQNPQRTHKVWTWLRSGFAPFSQATQQYKAIRTAFAMSVFAQACFYLSAFCIANLLGFSISPVMIGAILPLVALANSIPLSPGGIGIGETVASIAFSRFGFPIDTGAQIMLSLRIVLLFWALLGAAFYFVLQSRPKNMDIHTQPLDDPQRNI